MVTWSRDKLKERVKGGINKVRYAVKEKMIEREELNKIKDTEEWEAKKKDAKLSVQDKYEARRHARKENFKRNEGAGGGLLGGDINGVPGFVFGSTSTPAPLARKGRRGSRSSRSQGSQGGGLLESNDPIWGGMGGSDINSLVHGSAPQGSRRSQGSQGGDPIWGGMGGADIDELVHGRKRG